MSLIKQRFKGFRCEWDKSNFNTGNTTTVLLTSVSFNNVNKLSLVKLRSFSNYFRVAFAQYYSQQFINYFLQDKYLNNDERTKHRKTKHTFWFLPPPTLIPLHLITHCASPSQALNVIFKIPKNLNSYLIYKIHLQCILENIFR